MKKVYDRNVEAVCKKVGEADFGDMFVWEGNLYTRISITNIMDETRKITEGVTCLCLEGDEEDEIVVIPFKETVQMADGELHWHLVGKGE